MYFVIIMAGFGHEEFKALSKDEMRKELYEDLEDLNVSEDKEIATKIMRQYGLLDGCVFVYRDYKMYSLVEIDNLAEELSALKNPEEWFIYILIFAF